MRGGGQVQRMRRVGAGGRECRHPPPPSTAAATTGDGVASASATARGSVVVFCSHSYDTQLIHTFHSVRAPPRGQGVSCTETACREGAPLVPEVVVKARVAGRSGPSASSGGTCGGVRASLPPVGPFRAEKVRAEKSPPGSVAPCHARSAPLRDVGHQGGGAQRRRRRLAPAGCHQPPSLSRASRRAPPSWPVVAAGAGYPRVPRRRGACAAEGMWQ